MNVLITFYIINNFGGIINNNEGLVAGLRDLGHNVTTKLLVWKDELGGDLANRRRLTPESNAMGIDFDQELGWKWPMSSRIPYKGKNNIEKWKRYAETFDLIIWQIPVPTLQKENEGNTDWLQLYDVDVPQVIYVHDGNMVDGYPWIYAVQKHLTGAVGVHPCAYNSLENLPLPRAMAFSPQQNIEERVAHADKLLRDRAGWFSLQTFKAWKHVDDLVRAVPHMKNKEPKVLAGGGLHYFYMTSKDKLRPEYLAADERDPDMPRNWKGKRIWDLAKDAGMDYRDYLQTGERDKILEKARFVIDPSWSRKYAMIGDHFNRTIVEGVISGCVPIARNWGVSMNKAGYGGFFKADLNYIMIPWDARPKEFAEIVDDAINMKESYRKDMLEEGRKLLPLFDYKRTAQTFIDLANGKPAGVTAEKNDKGAFNGIMKSAGEEILRSFFEEKVEVKGLFPDHVKT